MADKVYQGGIPDTYDANMKNSGFGVSGEGETASVPGKADATHPRVVSEGGSGGVKTYSKAASENFLGDKGYTTAGTGMSVRSSLDLSMDVDNPDDISHADHDDDEDLPKK